MPNPEHAEKNEETQSRTPIGQALAEFYRRRKRLSSNFPKFPLSKRNLLGKIGTCALRLLALSPEGFTLSFEEEPALPMDCVDFANRNAGKPRQSRLN